MKNDVPASSCLVQGTQDNRPPSRADKTLSLLLRALILFALWAVLSGFFDSFHLTVGACSSLFVAWLSEEFWPPEGRMFRRPAMAFKLAGYALWLLKEIVKANIYVMRISLSPRAMKVIDPQIVRFRSRMTSKLGLTILANSITLTPGTITVYVDERGNFTVHALDGELAAGVPGDMETKLVDIFGGRP